MKRPSLLTAALVMVLASACSAAPESIGSTDPTVTAVVGGQESATPTEGGGDPGTFKPSGGMVRIVNTYIDEDGPVDVDIYTYTLPDGEFDQVGTLAAHVPYGSASDWFDPGLIERYGSTFSHWAVVRAGTTDDSLLDSSDATGVTPGIAITISLSTTTNFSGQLTQQWSTWIETGTAEMAANPAPLADMGLIEAVGFGLPDPEDQYSGWMYASAKGDCLMAPGAQVGTGPQPLAPDTAVALEIEPGTYDLRLNTEYTVGDDLTFSCDAPVGDSIPLSIKAGERVYLFVFAPDEKAPLQTLLLPFRPDSGEAAASPSGSVSTGETAP